MTIIQLRKDEYVRRFWSNCPHEFLAHIVTQVVPAARQDLTPWATHKILLDLQASALYRGVSRSDQLRLHSLTGRAVRIARDFVVERTPDGSPRRVRSTGGHHLSYTLQQPRAAREGVHSLL